jgi:hypothetical protein
MNDRQEVEKKDRQAVCKTQVYFTGLSGVLNRSQGMKLPIFAPLGVDVSTRAVP